MSNKAVVNKITGALSISQMSEALEILWRSEIKSDFNTRFIPFIEGAPGQGKTSIVEQFAKRVNAEQYEIWFDSQTSEEQERILALPAKDQKKLFENSGYYWRVQHLRLSQCDPTDIKGVPIFHDYTNQYGETVATCRMAPPDIFPILDQPESARRSNVIIFLDELRQATPLMQNLASSILDGTVGDERLDPSRTFIVVAANREQDRAGTFGTPMNVVNRIIWYEVNTSFTDWEAWALASNVNPYVIGFLESNQNLFNMEVPKEDRPYPSPRSWDKVARLIDSAPEVFINPNNPIGLQTMAGIIGLEHASKFSQWLISAASNYSVKDIWEGKKVSYPKPQESSITYGLVIEMVYRINNSLREAVRSSSYVSAIKKLDQEVEQGKISLADRSTKGSEALIKALEQIDAIDGINNCYKWIGEGWKASMVRAPLSALLNKLQDDNTKSLLRTLFTTSPKFAVAKQHYAELLKALNANK